MSAHILLTLLNEFGKRYKVRDLPCILLLFPNSIYKFDNTGAKIMDPI